MNRWEQYKVCKERGHSPGPYVTASVPAWTTCKYCRVSYRHETKLVEMQSSIPEEVPSDATRD